MVKIKNQKKKKEKSFQKLNNFLFNFETKTKIIFHKMNKTYPLSNMQSKKKKTNQKKKQIK